MGTKGEKQIRGTQTRGETSKYEQDRRGGRTAGQRGLSMVLPRTSIIQSTMSTDGGVEWFGVSIVTGTQRNRTSSAVSV